MAIDHPGRDESRSVVGETRTSWKKERWRVVGACSALWSAGYQSTTARPSSSKPMIISPRLKRRAWNASKTPTTGGMQKYDNFLSLHTARDSR
jgi:hypothetical protein